MAPFVEQLASLCRVHVTRWVFVPTHAIGRTLGERIALEGTNWLNLRFVTPLDLALRMGAPFLVERGVDPSEEAYEHFLDQHQRGDMAAVYEEAVKHPDWCPIQAQDCWTELPDTHWSPLQQAVMDSMPGERIPPRRACLATAPSPQRFDLTARSGRVVQRCVAVLQREQIVNTAEALDWPRDLTMLGDDVVVWRR